MERIGPYLSALPELFGITLLTILIFLSFRNAACNWNVPVFENEDDIYDALSEGEIDYEEFSSLMQMMHEKIDLNGKELFRLETIPGITRFDTESIHRYKKIHGMIHLTGELRFIEGVDFKRLKAFVRVLPGATLYSGTGCIEGLGKFTMKASSKIEDEFAPVAEFGFDCTWGGWSDNLKIRTYLRQKTETETTGWKSKKRYIEINSDIWRMKIGSFNVRIGEGIVLGNRFSLPINLRMKNPDSSNFLFDGSGGFNGILFEHKHNAFSFSALASFNKYALITDSFYGIDLSMNPMQSIFAGGTISFGKISGTEVDEFKRTLMFGLHGGFDSDNTIIHGEYALIAGEKSPGILIALDNLNDRMRFRIEGRFYGNSFNPIHSGAYASEDKIDFPLFPLEPEDSLSALFPSPFAGETGIRFEGRWQLSQAFIARTTMDEWTIKNSRENHIKGDAGVTWNLKPNMKIMTSIFMKDFNSDFSGNSRKKTTLDIVFNPVGKQIEYRFLLSVSRKTASDSLGSEIHYGYTWLEVKNIHTGPLILDGKIRLSTSNVNIMDKYGLEARLKESIIMKNGFKISLKIEQKIPLVRERTIITDTKLMLTVRTPVDIVRCFNSPLKSDIFNTLD